MLNLLPYQFDKICCISPSFDSGSLENEDVLKTAVNYFSPTLTVNRTAVGRDQSKCQYLRVRNKDAIDYRSDDHCY